MLPTKFQVNWLFNLGEGKKYNIKVAAMAGILDF